MGKTTEGRPFLVVTITLGREHGPAGGDPRRPTCGWPTRAASSPEDAERLIGAGKTIVALNHGIHSTEVGPPQASMLTAHWLASSDDPEVLEILDRCVVLLLPSHNPDGTQKVVEWYRKSLGTPCEGGEIPFLYHRYAGHDNNRDWYAFNQVESRLTVDAPLRPLAAADRPRPAPDGDEGARASSCLPTPIPTSPTWTPPSSRPSTPWAPTWPRASWPRARPGWWCTRSSTATRRPAPTRTPTAACASSPRWPPRGWRRPLEVPFADLQPSGALRPEAARPGTSPLPGRAAPGPCATSSTTSSRPPAPSWSTRPRNREFWLRNFTEVLRRAATRTDLFAFVLPGDAKDPLRARQARGDPAHGRGGGAPGAGRLPGAGRGRIHLYPAGSYVVRMQQPFSAFAKQVLERQHYPDLRQYPGGPPVRPYDVTAHTLPLLMGVDAAAVVARPSRPTSSPWARPARPSRASPQATGRGARFLALGHKTGDLVALGRLLRAGSPRALGHRGVHRSRARVRGGHPARPRRRSRGVLAPLAGRARPRGARRSSAAPKALALRAPRVGLYQSWVATMDEGWTRFVFEKQMGVAYETLHDADVEPGGAPRAVRRHRAARPGGGRRS